VNRGHEVELVEQNHIFSGASGANPARLHQGFHYPRSRLTRAYCQEHQRAFLARYGHLTRSVPVNIYAVAQDDSLVDFGTYCQILQGEVEFIRIQDTSEFSLANVEGGLLTGERHIVIRLARAFFEKELVGCLNIGPETGLSSNYKLGVKYCTSEFDWEIDCTFCARDAENIDRYEPCVTAILSGKSDKAVTIMDGPFPSLYPWDEEQSLNSLTSAKYTPLARCATYEEAKWLLDGHGKSEVAARANAMLEQLAHYWPSVRDLYSIVDYRLGIRAMPKSAADARLVDIVRTGERSLRVRAGKIDAVIHAEEAICQILGI
jgi:hypothetical protein